MHPGQIANLLAAMADTGELDHCVTPYDVKARVEAFALRRLDAYHFRIHHGPHTQVAISIALDRLAAPFVTYTWRKA